MAHREEEDQNPGTVLHVANLHPHTRERDIREEFSKYGDVLECRLILDPHTEESRCFAFVTMATPDLARELIRRMDGTKFDDRILKVDLTIYSHTTIDNAELQLQLFATFQPTHERDPEVKLQAAFKAQRVTHRFNSIHSTTGARPSPYDTRPLPPRDRYSTPPYLDPRLLLPHTAPPPYDYPPPRYSDPMYRGYPEDAYRLRAPVPYRGTEAYRPQPDPYYAPEGYKTLDSRNLDYRASVEYQYRGAPVYPATEYSRPDYRSSPSYHSDYRSESTRTDSYRTVDKSRPVTRVKDNFRSTDVRYDPYHDLRSDSREGKTEYYPTYRY